MSSITHDLRQRFAHAWHALSTPTAKEAPPHPHIDWTPLPAETRQPGRRSTDRRDPTTPPPTEQAASPSAAEQAARRSSDRHRWAEARPPALTKPGVRSDSPTRLIP
jgi:hypothetical protein